jgi:predicted O-methyltransferase YrrM
MLKLEGEGSPRSRTQAERKLGFIKPYVIGAASAAYLFSIGWMRSRNRAVIVDLSDRFGYRHNARVAPLLPRTEVDDVARDQTTVDIHQPQAADGNVSELELIVLARVTRAVQPRSIFEFGTFDGRTTLNLAANSSGDVYTIDLPASAADTAKGIDPQEKQFVEKSLSGARYRGTPLEKRITQLYGNSGTFAFEPYYDAIDLVFVDASHAYDYVISDSLHALRMLRGGRGTIVWHGYSRWDGVTAALNDLRGRHKSFAGLEWVEGTTLALLTL